MRIAKMALTLPNAKLAKKLEDKLKKVFEQAFGKDLEENLKWRGQELWLFAIDDKEQKLVDISGTVDQQTMDAINALGFWSSHAGYRANAERTLPLGVKNADIFLINTKFLPSGVDKIEPLIVHELAHLLEHTKVQPSPQGNDENNARAILDSLHTDILAGHSEEWALHLTAAARTLLEKKAVKQKTIRAWLEAAVPEIDRDGKPIYAR
jgi:hypothetical protein